MSVSSGIPDSRKPDPQIGAPRSFSADASHDSDFRTADSEPPAFAGGQGRTADAVERDGEGALVILCMAWGALALVALVALVVALLRGSLTW